jgi:translation initiation factor IF-2
LAKNLKLNIKNTQIAQAVDLKGLKSKLAQKAVGAEEGPAQAMASAQKGPEQPQTAAPEKGSKEEAPRVRARSRSAFAAPRTGEESQAEEPSDVAAEEQPPVIEAAEPEISEPRQKSSEELRREIFGDQLEELATPQVAKPLQMPPVPAEPKELPKAKAVAPKPSEPPLQAKPKARPPRRYIDEPRHKPPAARVLPDLPVRTAPVERLGPTGRHIKDLLPPPRPPKPVEAPRPAGNRPFERRTDARGPAPLAADKAKPKAPGEVRTPESDAEARKGVKPGKVKEFRDIKPAHRKQEPGSRSFDARDRQGLRGDDESGWRKRRSKMQHRIQEDMTIRPTTLKVRVPIAIKDLAAEMKLKASQLVAKLFMQGIVATLNDYLEDETTIQLLGNEFGCEITLDTAEEQRVRVTSKSIKEEISEADAEQLQIRPPIVAFMGHVDHGKTSLIDYIRKSNRAAGEAGAITQHIGAFKCHTAVGDITILDTPGHEAFSAMRARGADVTDIVVLVVAGDEGIRQQTIEAIQHAKAANVSIVVAINKCDKPNFDAENIYRQLSEQELLPEAWGGQTITVNCSAVTGEGIKTLLEMLALQAEVMELRADNNSRARGSVLESEMHKGLGTVATVLVQNGTLRPGDAVVFGQTWGRVKTMRNEFQQELKEAPPSTPVEITGLSGLPEAGEEFIVVKNDREARSIAEKRMEGIRQSSLLLKKRLSMENLFQQASTSAAKKSLNVILRADVQGSLEALKSALMKIESQKAELNIIFAGVGEVSESDVQLAAASKAVILGFHTQVESHADMLLKQTGVQVRLHDIIYHAVDDVKLLMAGLLDKIAKEVEKGKAEVKATFKSSQLGTIAGCIVTEGSVFRNCQMRVRRGKDVVWRGSVGSLKRVKEDVREVTKGLECGIVLNGYHDYEVGDILESFEITYITQEL